jgi:hypothetical protein
LNHPMQYIGLVLITSGLVMLKYFGVTRDFWGSHRMSYDRLRTRWVCTRIQMFHLVAKATYWKLQK